MKNKPKKKSRKFKLSKQIKCFRCNTKLTKSKLPDYFYYCPNCDEDFYKFEQEK